MYYSQLTLKKQSEIFSNIISLKLNISNLDKELQNVIKSNINLDDLLEYKYNFNKLIKGQKCFKHEGLYYPLNIKTLINKL